MMKVGDKMPDLSAPNQEGKEVNLQTLVGKKSVLFFFPKANTSGCTIEVNNFNENLKDLEKNGYQILGIGKDSVEDMKKFYDKNTLKYDLLADTSLAICNKFGVYGEKKMYGRTYMGIHRTTFVFDDKGILQEIIKKVKTKEAAQQVLQLD